MLEYELAKTIHAQNVEAGWWSDLATGESTVETRNRGELMMLIVSELSEASCGFADTAMDDHLPDLLMYHVELADAAIRILDLLGAECSRAEWTESKKLTQATAELPYGVPTQSALMRIVNEISFAMEAHRKGRRSGYLTHLMDALLKIQNLGKLAHANLPVVIKRKLAYNRARADHKVENRRADGGKAY